MHTITRTNRNIAVALLSTSILVACGESSTLAPSSINTTPVANDSTHASDGTPTLISLDASDLENDDLHYNIVKSPTHGKLTGTAPNFTYSPDNSFTGTDDFEFTASDAKTTSTTARVTIVITAKNTPPIASPQYVTLDKNTSAAITLAGVDSENETLSYALLSSPTRGSISGDAPNLLYTPQHNYVGLDSFSFRVSDGTTTSSSATVTIGISNTNTPPTSSDQTITLDEDTSVNFTLAGDDVDAERISFITTQPTNGALSGVAPTLTYTPNDDFNGTDSFTYTVRDQLSESSVGHVSITINTINDIPTAASLNLNTAENTSIPVTLIASDVDNDSLEYLVGQPRHGSLTGSAPNLS